MSGNNTTPVAPLSKPVDLQDNLYLCQIRARSLQASNQQWMRTNATLQEENARIRTQNATLQEENARMRTQLVAQAQHPQTIPPSQVYINRDLTKQIEDAKREAKDAKASLEYEGGDFIKECKTFERALAEKDTHILSLLAEIETKDVQLELLRQEIKEKTESTQLSQSENEQLRTAKDEVNNLLACAQQELDFERDAHCTTQERLEDALRDLGQERMEHDGTAADLETALADLEREKKRHEEAKIDLQESRNKLHIARYVWEFAAKIRLRWICSHPFFWSNRHETISDGNRAAHDANVIVDLALLSLGIIDDSYKKWLESKYEIDLENYIDYGKLKELKAKSKSTELINFKASMSEDLKKNTKSGMRFRELMKEIDEIRGKIAESHESEEEREKAFENNQSVTWVLKIMAATVSNRDRE
ncbi:hypothetical protein NA56DRAFT_700817 [Hyaloscypha hepaticicola]|uniref:Uncharacterized protein n=1 Tax=Hyaloscypha hepaticicola TaxID=2082293 RepID=A0A2J6QDJ7_9HELO|nr:hypothetical protein NA56DRAFT_700817 [Hyaloscypha hepaticicola]